MNARPTLSKKSFFGAALGTMLEYYDYALFSIFMPIFSPLFFPAKTVYESLVKGYFVLLIAMLARPLGGLAFGYLGDVLGRKRALLASMCGIACATMLIGLLPSYDILGIWATILIVSAKALQIFCFGGEFNGAGIYVVEHAHNKQEVLVGSLLTSTTLFGSLVASFFGILTTYPFMPAWSWRLAFVFGGLIGIFGIFYRKNMQEPPSFEPANLNQQSFKSMIKEYPRELIAGIFIGGFSTLPFTTVVTFINPALMSQGYFNNHQLMIMQTFLIFCAVATLILVGFIAGRWLPAKLMSYSALGLVVLAYPLLKMVDSGNFTLLLVGLTLMIVINEVFLSPAHAYFKNSFKMQYRYRASSFSFCLGMSLIGGLTPVVENYLYRLNNQFSSVAIWLILMSLATAWSLKRSEFSLRLNLRWLCKQRKIPI